MPLLVRNTKPFLRLSDQLIKNWKRNMKFKSDPLYPIFEKHLRRALMKDEPSDTLIERVVSEYVEMVVRRGLLPHRLREFLETDAREEVKTMLQKKTYGHYNLAEYKNNLSESKLKKGNA